MTTHPESPTRSPRLSPRNLIWLNAGLLLTLLGATVASTALAQNAAGARARGDYTMASGRISVGGPHAIYVLDSANQEVVALRWDNSKQTLLPVGYRSLSRDAQQVPGR